MAAKWTVSGMRWPRDYSTQSPETNSYQLLQPELLCFQRCRKTAFPCKIDRKKKNGEVLFQFVFLDSCSDRKWCVVENSQVNGAFLFFRNASDHCVSERFLCTSQGKFYAWSNQQLLHWESRFWVLSTCICNPAMSFRFSSNGDIAGAPPFIGWKRYFPRWV